MNTSDEITSIWTDIENWLKTYAPDRALELRSGAPPAAIAELEATFQRRLPADYVASLAIYDGKADLSDYSYLSIQDVRDNWVRLHEQEQAGSFAERRIDNPEAGIIQPRWWHPAWIPFAEDSGGNLLCLDLDPGPNGINSQVLRFERSMGPGPAGPLSFRAWLAEYRDGLRSGAYYVDEDGFIREQI